MLHNFSTDNVGSNWAKKAKSVYLFLNGQKLEEVSKAGRDGAFHTTNWKNSVPI